ncbi:unnamed protein product, partial [Amoebophrya sp. A25]|eukprot:GSA25T00009483001.1
MPMVQLQRRARTAVRAATKAACQPPRGVARRSREDFATLQEFKEYVRPLSFTSTREFRKWSASRERPPFIPSAPGRFYRREGWISFMDGLGYEWPSRSAASIQIAQQPILNVQCRNAQNAIDWVQRAIAGLSEDGYEILQLPRFGRASILLRSRSRNAGSSKPDNELCDSDTTSPVNSNRTAVAGADGVSAENTTSTDGTEAADQWWALRVKSAASKRKAVGDRYVFCFAGGIDPDVGVVTSSPQHEEINFLHPCELAPNYKGKSCFWIYSSDLQSVRELRELDQADSKLSSLLKRLPTKSFQEWLSYLPSGSANELRECLTRQLVSQLVTPAELTFEHAFKYSDVHNAVLGGQRVLLRCSRIDEGSGKAKVVFDRRRHEGVKSKGRVKRLSVPFDESDDIDFFTVMLYRGKAEEFGAATEGILSGVFVFPKAFLRDAKILSVQFRGGRYGLGLYPPGCATPSETRRESARKQQQYYFPVADLQQLRSSSLCQDDQDESQQQQNALSFPLHKDTIDRFKTLLMTCAGVADNINNQSARESETDSAQS